MVIELCRTTKEVKLQTTNFNGTSKSVLNNSIAIRIDKNSTTFIDIVACGKIAEVIANNLHKGDQLQVVGKLRNKKTKFEEKEINTFTLMLAKFILLAEIISMMNKKKI